MSQEKRELLRPILAEWTKGNLWARAELIPECHRGWEIRVELWLYYGIEEALPSREQDR